jgi:hypothetical protein
MNNYGHAFDNALSDNRMNTPIREPNFTPAASINSKPENNSGDLRAAVQRGFMRMLAAHDQVRMRLLAARPNDQQ